MTISRSDTAALSICRYAVDMRARIIGRAEMGRPVQCALPLASISDLLFFRERESPSKSCRASEAHFLNFFALEMCACVAWSVVSR